MEILEQVKNMLDSAITEGMEAGLNKQCDMSCETGEDNLNVGMFMAYVKVRRFIRNLEHKEREGRTNE